MFLPVAESAALLESHQFSDCCAASFGAAWEVAGDQQVALILVGRVKKPFAVNCQADIAGLPFVAGAVGVHVGVLLFR